jgi:NAD dependent epimerase/dehydratase
MYLKGKKVLVTGSDGFIGSHLVQNLLNEDCEVRAFVYYNSFNSWGLLEDVQKDRLNNIEVVSGDIRDPFKLRKTIEGIDVVFHLAALIGIPYSYQAPDSYIDTNIKGTLNVLQACMDCNVSRVVVTSTSEVYGTAKYVPIDEKHPLQPQSPYSASKISADAIAESFYRSFDLPVVIARPFNTYGPGQSVRAVIPTIITQLLYGNKDVKLGSLHPTRDLNYVDDICRGFIAIAKCDEAIGKVINIGSGDEISIKDLASLIIKLTGKDARVVSDDIRNRPEKSEVERLVCGNSLLKDMTGWRPGVSLEDGLIKTIEWFKDKEILNKYKSDAYNV